MKKNFFLLGFVCILFMSCQREISFNTANGGGGGNGNTNGLLIKTVAVTGSDTMTTLYGYDSQSRLETMTIDGKSNGMIMHSYKKYIRDGLGRVSKVLQKLDQMGIPSTDTAVQIVHYPTASAMEYDYTVNTISMMGFSTVDSAVYSYASGKMNSFSSYMSSPLMGPTPLLTTKYDFVYDASGRVNILKMFSSGSSVGGPLSPIMNQTYTYGASLNSTWSAGNAAQNYIVNGMPNTSNDIVVKMQADDLTTPANSFTLTTTYSLNGNRPVSGTMTSTTGQVTKYSFYYQ